MVWYWYGDLVLDGIIFFDAGTHQPTYVPTCRLVRLLCVREGE